MYKIIALGGYGLKEHVSGATKIHREIINLSGKKNPEVLFMPTASNDSQKYIDRIEKEFGEKLKCKVDHLLLYKKRPTKKEIAKKILGTDIIYVGGGNTLKMMNLWRKLEVDKILKRAYQKGIVLSGISAGSICWFNYGVSDSRQYKNPQSHQYIRVKGLGLIKTLHSPHYKSKTSDKGHRTKGLKLIAKRTPGVAIALEDLCALEIAGNKFRIINDQNAKAYKVYYKDGIYFEKEILQEKFLPLTLLFKKI